jgi:hypothetical protein
VERKPRLQDDSQDDEDLLFYFLFSLFTCI